MRPLLDTHVLIWWMQGDSRLSSAAYSSISDPSNEVVVSSVAAIEMAIKLNTGKLRIPAPLDQFWSDALAALRATELPLYARHASALYALPMHHRDPFDRMLVAQAVAESLSIVSGDAAIASYSPCVIW